MESSGISKKEYLKKYLSGGDKKKKKKKSTQSLIIKSKIVDDDIDLKNMKPVNEDDLEIFDLAEDAPQIAGIIDERPEEIRIMSEYRSTKKWKIVTDEYGIEDVKITAIDRRKSDDGSPKREKEISIEITKNSERNESGSDEPPAREKESERFDSGVVKNLKKEIDSDSSPPRRSKKDGYDSDASPPRRPIKKEKDASPPRRPIKKEKDDSPHRRKAEKDISLPRRKPEKYDSDESPPRRSRKGYDSSASPPRRPIKKEKDYDSSSSRRRRKGDSDTSPPRKRHNRDDSDTSPPRRRQNRNDSDTSPPRRRQNRNDSDTSPPRRRQNRNDSDTSPPRKNISSKNKDRSESSTSRSKEENNSKSSKKDGGYGLIVSKSHDEEKKEKKNSQLEKTLSGKKAGLQSAEDMRKESERLRQKEREVFEKMSDDVTGRHATAIVRSRKTGRRQDAKEEAKKKREKEEKEAEKIAQYAVWGKGVKQIQDRQDKMKEDLHEMSKPLARYRDDKDLEEMLKNQEREGDPMLEYIRKKKKSESKSYKPQYEGAYMPNRYGIRPGHKWDGVDRSNGYEKKWFDEQNAKKAREEEAFKWSTADM